MLLKVNEGDTEHGEPFEYKIQTDEKEYGEYSQYFITDKETIGQFTGLHDKNGKEIYEGDIVLIQGKTEILDIKGQVEYSNTFAEFIITDTKSIVNEAEPLGDYEGIEVIRKYL